MKKTIAIMLVLMCMVSMLFANGSSEVSASDNVDSWPSKPVNIVITSSAGGDGDYLMRLLGTYLEKELGQSLVITNLAGGNGSIGMDDLMNHEADGYTFYVNNTCALSANQANGLVDYDWTVSDPVGVFAKHSRDEYKQMIEQNGGKNVGSISGSTDFILAGENMGPSKLEKANKLGIAIIDEDTFLAMLEN